MRRGLGTRTPPSRLRDVPPRGFTLIEVMVSLVILGLIVATVYMSLGGALDSIDRVRRAQEPYQKGRVARSFLMSALRSTSLFSGLPQDGFVAVDSSRAGIPRDELTFVAFSPPGARSARMQLHLYVADSAGGSVLKLGVRSIALGDSLAPYTTYTLTNAVRGLDMSFLAAAADDRTTWLDRWESRIRLPHAIQITFLPSTQPDPVWETPVIVQIPAGRTL
jgi:prepilin-type N-terminal cleavage/methylation domain-containing protein